MQVISGEARNNRYGSVKQSKDQPAVCFVHGWVREKAWGVLTMRYTQYGHHASFVPAPPPPPPPPKKKKSFFFHYSATFICFLNSVICTVGKEALILGGSSPNWTYWQICTSGQSQYRRSTLHWVYNNTYLGELEWPGTFLCCNLGGGLGGSR